MVFRVLLLVLCREERDRRDRDRGRDRGGDRDRDRYRDAGRGRGRDRDRAPPRRWVQHIIVIQTRACLACINALLPASHARPTQHVCRAAAATRQGLQPRTAYVLSATYRRSSMVSM